MWLWTYITLWALYIIVAAIAAYHADDDIDLEQEMPDYVIAAFLFIIPGFIVMALLGIILFVTGSM